MTSLTSITPLLGVIIGALISYFTTNFVWEKRILQKQKKLLLALKTEISIIKPNIDRLSPHHQGSESSVYFAAILRDAPIIYPTGGLYYILNKEIFDLPEQLSQKIYEFYINLIEAENYRKIIVQKPDSLVMMQITGLCNSVIKVHLLIPEIIQMIDDELETINMKNSTFYDRFYKQIKKMMDRKK